MDVVRCLRIAEAQLTNPLLETEEANINLDTEGDWDFASFLNKIEDIYVLGFDVKNGKTTDLELFRDKLDKLMVKKDFKPMIDIDGESRFALYTRKDSGGNTSDVLMIAADEEETSFIWVSGE